MEVIYFLKKKKNNQKNKLINKILKINKKLNDRILFNEMTEHKFVLKKIIIKHFFSS